MIVKWKQFTYYTTKQQEASYDERYTNVKPISAVAASKEEQEDEEYEMCRAFVIQAQKASTSHFYKDNLE